MKIFSSALLITSLIESIISFQLDLLNTLSDEFILSINNEQQLWKAGRNNFPQNISENYIRNLLGFVPMGDKSKLLPTFKHNLQGVEIPDSFDWRKQLPECTTLSQIRDQGACGSCWAFAVTEIASDRICINSQGKTNVEISANNLLSCCVDCGFGCGGGCPYMALKYWKSTGIVTGGAFNSSAGCQPYEIPPCEHHGSVGPRPPCEGQNYDTPKCKNNCETGYPKKYEDDLYYAKSIYCLNSDVEQIQTEIMKNGPVAVAFEVYEDFLVYKSGVYKHITGGQLGIHVVKMIGWGVEDKTPYWLIANSWNEDWGEKGYFKIVRGEDNCNIETLGVCAGVPA